MGAGWYCMNEEHYQTLGSPPLEPTDIDFWLRTASRAQMPGMGFLTCNMRVGNEYYRQQFIVCKQLTPGIILGRYFLSRNLLGITWGPEGVLQLRDNQDIPVQTAEEATTFPAVLTAKVTVPSRSLILIPVLMTLPLCENKAYFDFPSISTIITHQGSFCCSRPKFPHVNCLKQQNTPKRVSYWLRGFSGFC